MPPVYQKTTINDGDMNNAKQKQSRSKAEAEAEAEAKANKQANKRNTFFPENQNIKTKAEQKQ